MTLKARIKGLLGIKPPPQTHGVYDFSRGWTYENQVRARVGIWAQAHGYPALYADDGVLMKAAGESGWQVILNGSSFWIIEELDRLIIKQRG